MLILSVEVLPMNWIRLTFVAAALALVTSAAAQAEEMPCTANKLASLKYLCVCPGTNCKPALCMDWDWKCTCDNYCKKSLPCAPAPCLKFLCDNYDCKPKPCCYPKSPCPVR